MIESNSIQDIQKSFELYEEKIKSIRKNTNLDKNILPGVEIIGMSYNPFDKYADIDSTITQLFDWTKTQNKTINQYQIPSILETGDNNKFSSYENYGQTISQYQKEFSTRVKIEGAYNFFSGSVSSTFDRKVINNTENMFYLLEQSLYLWTLQFKPSTKNLRDFMVDDIRDELDALNYNDPIEITKFFDKFGSHFLTGITMGGKISISSYADKKDFRSEEEFKAEVKASYLNLVGNGISAEVETKSKSESHSSTSSSVMKVNTFGGDPTKAFAACNRSKSSYDDWAESVRQYPCLVDFKETNSMQAIWTLCKSNSQAKAMENHFNNVWAIQKKNQYQPKINYIHKLDIISGNNPDIEHSKSSFIKCPVDLNEGAKGEFIYLCYEEKTFDYQNPQDAVTDIMILFNNQPCPSGYEKLHTDLNKGAGGDYIHLCYKKEPYDVNTAIKKIFVESGDSSNFKSRKDTNRVDGDLNRGAKGKFVYLFTLI